MELVSIFTRDLAKWCVCSCTACSLVGGPSNTWFRSVKRKQDGFETGNGLHVPGFDLYSNARVQLVNECAALRETVSSQQAAIQDSYTELEEERNASSSAATEAMSIILKLQRENAEIQMEATQFKRFAEGKIAHDQQEIMAFEDLLYKREQAIQALTCEALAYKRRMVGYGLKEAKAEGEKDDLIQNLSVDENLCARFDPPAYNYLPLKCNLNQKPGDDIEDVEYVEKYAFGETPHAQEHLRNLEQRICQMNVFEKVIVGHSPKRSRHSGRLSTDSSNSVLAKEMGSEFTRDSSRFNTSFKKTEFVLEMDELSSSGRMDNASAVRDDVNDTVSTIDSVYNGVPYNRTAEPKPGLGICDDYASTTRETLNQLICLMFVILISSSYMRLQAFEADRESMGQTIISMRTDKAQLVLSKEIAQHSCKEMSPERRVAVRKPSLLGSLSFMPVFKVP